MVGRRHDLLRARQERRSEISNGDNPGFLSATAHIRHDPSWRVAGAGPGLVDRRIEITGPTDPKMTINACNSGANCWMADLEDATSPTWDNVIGGQLSLFDLLRNQLDFTSPDGKYYSVGARWPTVVLRPRGWHLCDKHIEYVDRAGHRSAVSASLLDFGLYFFHNAKLLIAQGAGPYFYLPKLENHLEARLWNDVFELAQDLVGIPRGTIRVTVLIETVTAAFEMEEILYELREHCAGLNAGRWDYIFSAIKNFRDRGPTFMLPDRSQITMTVPFMRAYTELLVATCHRRGAYAIGGMSAFIPNRLDPDVTERALAQVSADKKREAEDGFDGSWVAHPGLVQVARKEFDAVLGAAPNQLSRRRDDVQVTAAHLLDFASAGHTITDAGVLSNVSVAVRYLDAWLRGSGAVGINNLMEDAATAEISRSQIWQWIRNSATTVEGTLITREYVRELGETVVRELRAQHGRGVDRLTDAMQVFTDSALAEDYPTFITVGAYCRFLVERGPHLPPID